MKNKDIKYLNKDFSNFKEDLINYAKTYFPNTYTDFSPSSPGNMFIEMAAYVGDVLSFYQDSKMQETLLAYAKEKENLFSLAYMLGYRPQITSPAFVELDVYQLLPSKTTGTNIIPDFNYSTIINPGMQVKSSTSDVSFYVEDNIDFSYSSSLSPTEVSVYQVDNDNKPEYFLLKKKVKALSGTLKTSSFNFGEPTQFPTITLNDEKIIKIINVTDNENDIWYEVPYLAQETIITDIRNIYSNDPNFSNDATNVPYLLRLKKVPKRFVSRFTSEGILTLEFGSGISSNADEEIIPNPNNVGNSISDGLSKLNEAFDPSNFLFTKTYGIAPYNTTLTVSYLTGGGVISNVPANTVTDIVNLESYFINGGLDPQLSDLITRSIAVNNFDAASGGSDGDSESEIRLNTMAAFSAQMRAVNNDDYALRALSMPSKYGALSKVYVIQDQIINTTFNDNNPLALSMYVLGYNEFKQLTPAYPALKQNLKTYLSQYKMATDAINIKDAYIINIAVQFNILVLPNYNNNEVLLRCINAVKSYFDIDKWQINQPIVLSEIYTLLDQIKGVQTVQKVEILNKSQVELGYSQYSYDIKSATRNNIIYPSLDPCIFEVKYPNSDISGRISSF